MLRRLVLWLMIGTLAATAGCTTQEPERYALVPWPEQLEERPGTFVLDEETQIVFSDPSNEELRAVGEELATQMRSASVLPVRLSETPVTDEVPDNTIAFVLTEDDTAEQYQLDVTPERAIVSAGTPHGLFYGMQTLRQLLPPEVEEGLNYKDESWAIPAVAIDDAPRFGYRGMHLDVGRHVFPVSFIKKYIDLLARYKINTFHWHLTEDQGWRIEIEQYPRLTEVGACRDSTMAGHYEDQRYDGAEYCGYYTQEEVREIVAYAQERYVTIIPEIEMPGHSSAALTAYPELACTEGPFEVGTRWGIYEDIYCPSETTFAFLEDVLTEVMALFPSEYIHIGGDEAPKARWEESELAQSVIEREGLADEHELQSYFIQRIERFLNENGRRLIGWDEILEGGLSPNATVMSWRGTEGGIEAAQQGHDAIMTPTSALYFDYYQDEPEREPLAIGGHLTLREVYDYEPIPEALTEDEAQHILGPQGNVWTEYMKTPEKVEYMAFPRALALAEIAWSPRATRDWEHFTNRLPAHLDRLDALKVHYRPPNALEDGV